MVIGLSLSLAIVLGGLWLAGSRRLSPGSGLTVGLLVLALVGEMLNGLGWFGSGGVHPYYTAGQRWGYSLGQEMGQHIRLLRG